MVSESQDRPNLANAAFTVDAPIKKDDGSFRPEAIELRHLMDRMIKDRTLFYPQTLPNLQHLLPQINMAAEKLIDSTIQIGKADNTNMHKLAARSWRDAKNALRPEQVQQASIAGYEKLVVIALQGLGHSLKVGRLGEEPSGKLKKIAGDSARTLTHALAFEMMMQQTDNNKPNINLDILRLYAIGAFRVEQIDPNDLESIRIDIPFVLDGKSYLACHKKGMTSIEAYHDWTEECSEAVSISLQSKSGSSSIGRHRVRLPIEHIGLGRSILQQSSASPSEILPTETNNDASKLVQLGKLKMPSWLARRVGYYIEDKKNGLPLNKWSGFEEKYGFIIDAYESDLADELPRTTLDSSNTLS